MSFGISNGDTVNDGRIATRDSSSVIGLLLRATWFGYVARIVLTFMFWSSGLAKLIDFNGGLAEMAHFGLEPAWLFNIATIIVVFGGSLLIVLDRWAWLGAGALAVFTALTIPIAHGFWAMEEPFRTIEFHVVMEHVTVIGALIVVACASATRKKRAREG
jgi:transmembrane protein